MTCAARWAAACLLFAILISAGCAPQPEAKPPAKAGSPGGSLLEDPGASPPPSPTSSPVPSPSLTATLVPTPSPTATPVPSPSPTATPVPTPSPTATPTPSPTATPTLRQLTKGGCCTQPFWSPDSQQVLFIDKPGPELPVGIWAVDVTQPQPTPELLTEHIAFYTADLSFRIELGQDTTVIQRLDAPLAGAVPLPATVPPRGTSWELPAEGRPISISPGTKRVAWQLSDEDLLYEERTTQVWVADFDGGAPQMVAELPRGGFSGWISDDVLLLSGRESLESEEQVLFTLSLIDGREVELVRGKRLRGGLLSPGGAWLAYFISLDEDPAQNGMWLVRSDGSERRQLERELFGAYQWRDSHRLLIVPFQADAVSHAIWELDAKTGQARALTDPGLTPFKIANGDWDASPDGRHVIFVESRDRNIWLLTLPD